MKGLKVSSPALVYLCLKNVTYLGGVDHPQRAHNPQPLLVVTLLWDRDGAFGSLYNAEVVFASVNDALGDLGVLEREEED